MDEEDLRDGDRGGQREAGGVQPGRAAGRRERRGVAARRCRRSRPPGSGRRCERGAKGAAPPSSRRRPPGPIRTSGHQSMGWDDEELDTQIFDKEEVKPVAAEDLFFEDDDRTVANEPAPDILEQARPPELLTPRPITLASEDIKMTPPPVARPLPPPLAARRPTLVGVPPAVARLPTPLGVGPPAPPPPPPGPPPGRNASPDPAFRAESAGGKRSAAAAAAPQPTPMRRPRPPPPQRFHEPDAAPFGIGQLRRHVSAKPGPPGRRRADGGRGRRHCRGGLLVQQRHQAGAHRADDDARDATVLVDNVKVGDNSPVSIERPPGPYTLSVTRDGYARNDQNIELEGGTAAVADGGPGTVAGHRLRADQRPAGATGVAGRRAGEGDLGTAGAHELPRVAHQPRDTTCWRSGARTASSPGARTSRSSPGAIRKIHATLIPAVGGAPSGSGKAAAPVGASPPAAPGREVAIGRRWDLSARRRRHRRRPPVEPPACAQTAGRRDDRPAAPGARGYRASRRSAAGPRSLAPRGPTSGASVREAPLATTVEFGGGGEETPAPRRTPAVASEDSRGRRRLLDHGQLDPVVRGLDRRQEHDQAHADRRLQAPLRQAQAGVQARRHADRPDREHQRQPGQNFKQRYTLATED